MNAGNVRTRRRKDGILFETETETAQPIGLPVREPLKTMPGQQSDREAKNGIQQKSRDQDPGISVKT